MRTWNGLFEIQAILCSQRDRQFHFDDQQSNQIAQVFSNYLYIRSQDPKKLVVLNGNRPVLFPNIVSEDLEKCLASEYLGFIKSLPPPQL